MTTTIPAGWLPIESAPKDGTETWAYNGEQARMRWLDDSGKPRYAEQGVNHGFQQSGQGAGR